MLLALCFFWHTLFVASIVPNLVLLYLIVKKSNLMIGRPYNILLIDMTVSDILISLGGWFSMPCSIPASDTKPTVFLGLCQYVGAEICYHSSRIFQHLIYNNVCIILASFIIRRNILLHTGTTYTKVGIAAVLAYIPALISLIIYDGIPKAVGYIDGSNPILAEVELPREAVYAYASNELGSWHSQATAIIAPTIQNVTTVLSLGLRLNLSKILNEVAQNQMSEATKIMHRSLIKTLTLQAVVPVIAMIGGLFYLLASGHLSGFPVELLSSPLINSISTLINLLIPFLNSTSALFYIPLYRNSIISMCRQRKPTRSISISTMYI